ncbi:hypothetical protein J1N35_001495 [Gossypium stocksii]|uniref:Uncharacterized protein n=1 Tax=Gossypium stocksii TaxID=47602 RepID=A0A9D3WJ11_9ROSI|nr:hypothetical protein J1N35_001495 [Gossypium stocksii]
MNIGFHLDANQTIGHQEADMHFSLQCHYCVGKLDVGQNPACQNRRHLREKIVFAHHNMGALDDQEL